VSRAAVTGASRCSVPRQGLARGRGWPEAGVGPNPVVVGGPVVELSAIASPRSVRSNLIDVGLPARFSAAEPPEGRVGFARQKEKSEGAGTRTLDQRIKSPLLYRLSYTLGWLSPPNPPDFHTDDEIREVVS
jgi:hypothetical protein